MRDLRSSEERRAILRLHLKYGMDKSVRNLKVLRGMIELS
jgi:hypothetical protein